MLIVRELKGYQKSISTLSKGRIRFMGVFSLFMKEMVEMMYLTQEPLLLCGEKYKKEIGALPQTSYSEGLQETIAWMENNKMDKILK